MLLKCFWPCGVKHVAQWEQMKNMPVTAKDNRTKIGVIRYVEANQKRDGVFMFIELTEAHLEQDLIAKGLHIVDRQ